MSACGTYTGILFSRRPCGQPGVLNCGRCKAPVCKQHVRPQAAGRFLCPSCDAYEDDDDWRYSSRDNNWRYRSSSRRDDDTVVPAAAAGAAATQLSDDDKPGLNAAGAWHGPDQDGDAGGAPDTSDDGDFDAS